MNEINDIDTNYIEFKKERDLGTIMSDTFAFLRENWKAYFTTIIKIAGPAMLVSALITVYFITSVSDFASNAEAGDLSGIATGFFASAGLLTLAAVVVYILIAASSLYFIKSYIDNKGNVDYSEVRSNSLKNIWSFLGLGILAMIIIWIGFIFFMIPGIYMALALSLATSIMVFERKDVMDTISQSFKLIKGQWWNTFGTIFVVMIIISIIGGIFSVPVIIYQFINSATSSSLDASLALFEDPIYLGLNFISYLGKYILSSISLIATALIYFDLNEQKNLTGTIEKIDSLGK